MTLIAPAWRAWEAERSACPARGAAAAATLATSMAETAPMPRLTEVVHSVTATFGVAGWTLRFGPSGQSAVVRRLADADAAARALVAAGLGLPAAALRVRIVPDRDTVAALRRPASARSWWRPSWRQGPGRV